MKLNTNTPDLSIFQEFTCKNCSKLMHFPKKLPPKNHPRNPRSPVMSCFHCSAQYMYNIAKKDGVVIPLNMQVRFGEFNMFYRFMANNTSIVKYQRTPKPKPEGYVPEARQEWHFEGLVLPARFLEMAAFL